jgi:hypothetical protein
MPGKGTQFRMFGQDLPYKDDAPTRDYNKLKAQIKTRRLSLRENTTVSPQHQMAINHHQTINWAKGRRILLGK